jgi:beta-mannosidase
VLVWLKLTVKGEMVSDNLVSFVPPKDLGLTYPRLGTTIARAGDDFVVTIRTQKPALWVWLSSDEFDARYSDNFVHVTSDTPARIVVRPDRAMTKEEFKKALRVRSLWDTYN